jgi:hypothetical protein
MFTTHGEAMRLIWNVAVISAILGSGCRYVRNAEMEMTGTRLKGLGWFICVYQAINGRYPANLSEISSLRSLPAPDLGAACAELCAEPCDCRGWVDPSRWPDFMMTATPVDAWGTGFRYRVTPNAALPFALWSAGPDKVDRTSDDLMLASLPPHPSFRQFPNRTLDY